MTPEATQTETRCCGNCKWFAIEPDCVPDEIYGTCEYPVATFGDEILQIVLRFPDSQKLIAMQAYEEMTESPNEFIYATEGRGCPAHTPKEGTTNA